MSTTTRRAPVTVRIAQHHLEQLQRLAIERDTTVSRLVARAVSDKLDHQGELDETSLPRKALLQARNASVRSDRKLARP